LFIGVNCLKKYCNDGNVLKDNVKEKWEAVFLSNAGTNSRAMMIKCCHTSHAIHAMLRSNWSINITFLTKSLIKVKTPLRLFINIATCPFTIHIIIIIIKTTVFFFFCLFFLLPYFFFFFFVIISNMDINLSFLLHKARLLFKRFML